MVPKALLGFLLFGVALAVNFPTAAQCTTLCDQYLLNCSSTYDIYTDQTACEMECSRFPITTTCAGKSDGCIEAATENSYTADFTTSWLPPPIPNLPTTSFTAPTPLL
jgi:hypothetical protein